VGFGRPDGKSSFLYRNRPRYIRQCGVEGEYLPNSILERKRECYSTASQDAWKSLSNTLAQCENLQGYPAFATLHVVHFSNYPGFARCLEEIIPLSLCGAGLTA
jgi:hypothetical protein